MTYHDLRKLRIDSCVDRRGDVIISIIASIFFIRQAGKEFY
jgi:hypothetical protein